MSYLNQSKVTYYFQDGKPHICTKLLLFLTVINYFFKAQV